MNENVQTATMRVEPRNQPIELLRIEGELATPVRMRPNEFLVNPTHGDGEQISRLLTQFARLLGGLLVEVDVRVIGGVQVLRPLYARSTRA
jgi:hypothetical protein